MYSSAQLTASKRERACLREERHSLALYCRRGRRSARIELPSRGIFFAHQNKVSGKPCSWLHIPAGRPLCPRARTHRRGCSVRSDGKASVLHAAAAEHGSRMAGCPDGASALCFPDRQSDELSRAAPARPLARVDRPPSRSVPRRTGFFHQHEKCRILLSKKKREPKPKPPRRRGRQRRPSTDPSGNGPSGYPTSEYRRPGLTPIQVTH